MTSVTLFYQLKLGADGMDPNAGGGMIKKVMFFLPVPLFFLTWNFPAAIGFYWACTNVISVIQAKFLRMPGIREKFGIPPIKKHTVDKLGPQQKSMTQQMRESWDNYKIQRDIIDRKQHDERLFRDANLGKTVKTFKY